MWATEIFQKVLMNIFRIYKIDLVFKTGSKTNWKIRKQKQMELERERENTWPLTSPAVRPTGPTASHRLHRASRTPSACPTRAHGRAATPPACLPASPGQRDAMDLLLGVPSRLRWPSHSLPCSLLPPDAMADTCSSSPLP